jgi:hypothetical protein
MQMTPLYPHPVILSINFLAERDMYAQSEPTEPTELSLGQSPGL